MASVNRRRRCIRLYNPPMASFILALLLFVTNPQTDQRAHAAAIVAAMGAKDFAKVEAEFDEKMKTALPPGRLAASWDTLLAQTGAFKSCGDDVRVRNIADKQMVISGCTFERAKVDAQIAFDQAGKISGLSFRPAVAPVAPYALPPYATAGSSADSDITIGTEWALPGTLTVPVGAGPFPAVVLVHGSGPSDRDETVGATRPFKDLALGLAARGVAVLRYEKR